MKHIKAIVTLPTITEIHNIYQEALKNLNPEDIKVKPQPGGFYGIGITTTKGHPLFVVQQTQTTKEISFDGKETNATRSSNYDSRGIGICVDNEDIATV